MKIMYKYQFTYLALQLKNKENYHVKNIGIFFFSNLRN